MHVGCFGPPCDSASAKSKRFLAFKVARDLKGTLPFEVLSVGRLGGVLDIAAELSQLTFGLQTRPLTLSAPARNG